MLASIKFFPQGADIAMQYEISQTIMGLKNYFRKFNYDNTSDEVMQQAFEHACKHYDPTIGSLSPYIKKLAQTLSKNKDKVSSVEYMDCYMTSKTDSGCLEAVTFVDFYADEVVIDDNLSYNLRQDIVELALGYMEDFSKFVKSFRTLNTSTLRLKEYFKRNVHKLCSRYGDASLVTKEMTALYEEYEEDFIWFLELELGEEDVGKWVEKNDRNLRVSRSRIRLVSKDNVPNFDADYDEYILEGNLVPTQKRVLKVDFEQVWEDMCDKLDSDETNECVFIIGNNRLVRTYANGIMEELNIDLYKVYDIIREEIATNILKDLGGHLLHLGSKSVYLLVNTSHTPYEIPKRIIKGYEIGFQITDITEELLVEEDKG